MTDADRREETDVADVQVVDGRIPVVAARPGEPVRWGPRDERTEALRSDLAAAVEGEVRFDAQSRALYATDASNFRHPPIGVVVPRTIEDVVAVHRVCAAHDAPILNRGCGTSLSGETVNHAVVVDSSKHLHAILEVDPEARLAHVEPGAINQAVNDRASEHGLVFGPDPATHEYCTIGGNVGNNSCGVHSVQSRMAGLGSRTSDNLERLEVLTYDGVRMEVGPTSPEELERIVAEGGRRGQIYRDLRDLRDRYGDLIRERYAEIPRRVSGYNLDELLPEKGFDVARALTGTEGTCVTVLRATLKLVPDPPARALLVVGYEDIFHAARHITEVTAHRPLACEAVDNRLFRNEVALGMHPDELSQLPEGGAWLLVELGADTRADAEAQAEALARELGGAEDPPCGTSVFDDPAQEARLWQVRESGLGATAFPPDATGEHWPGWEDSAVSPEVMEPYLRDLGQLYDEYGFTGAMYGHLGDGCVHSRIDFDLRTPGGLATYRRFMEAAADLVVSYGGSLSGEHGDGQQRGELLPRMYGDELVEAFREFKRIWDPRSRMNPGKVVDARPLDHDLRLGVTSNPPRPRTAMSFGPDGDDFAHAALRCVGVGKCRTPDGVDVMCPSFVATREEAHSTRGRARLLYEMLEGEVITDGWRSQEVKDALDLCLSCKGCTNDCPVNVDMPTYKAEFLHHHWAGRLRPRHAYVFGYIDKHLRLASRVPRLANLALRAPGLGRALKRAAGVTVHRPAPAVAPQTLQDWFSARPVRTEGRPVVLWPDTFNNFLHVEVGKAAVEALEACGWRILMPRGHVCCGRPLYDHGFLGSARRYLERSLDVLRDEVRAGIPVVGLEPSCLATFRDELANVLPHDDDAARLREGAFHLSELLADPRSDLPARDGRAVLWTHCHQKATGGPGPARQVLERMGMEVSEASGGCCGLAGSWGFEADHYDLSMECAEQGLLPAVRDAGAHTLVVADGFSCQTQVAQGSARRAHHLAEVVAGTARRPR